MNPAHRAVALALGILAAGAGTAASVGAQTPAPDTRPPCIHALVALLDTIDSSRAKPGDGFTFALVDAVSLADGTQIAAGNVGYGVIANATHAERGGRGGYLALETRFAELPDGKHLPVIIDRLNDTASAVVGGSGNAPGVLGFIPIVGYAVGGYDSLHHGKDATIPRGTRVGVFLGDEAARGTCRPAAATTAAASPAPQPSASP